MINSICLVNDAYETDTVAGDSDNSEGDSNGDSISDGEQVEDPLGPM